MYKTKKKPSLRNIWPQVRKDLMNKNLAQTPKVRQIIKNLLKHLYQEFIIEKIHFFFNLGIA